MSTPSFAPPAGPAAAPGGPTVETLYATGFWLLSEARIDDAAAVFRVMVQASPGDERGWLGLGECHERVGQPRIALELYAAGELAAPSSTRCVLAHARLLRAMDDGADIEPLLERASDLAAGDPALLALIADVRRGA